MRGSMHVVRRCAPCVLTLSIYNIITAALLKVVYLSCAPLAYIILYICAVIVVALLAHSLNGHSVNVLVVQGLSPCKRSMRLNVQIVVIGLATLPEWKRGCELACLSLYLTYTLYNKTFYKSTVFT